MPVPRAVRVAEIGFDADRVELVMLEELGAIVLGEGAAQVRRQGGEPAFEAVVDRLGVFSRLPGEQDMAGLALLRAEDDGAGSARQQQVGFPMAALASAVDVRRAARDGDAVLDVRERPGRPAVPAAPALAARQIVVPSIGLGAPDLGVRVEGCSPAIWARNISAVARR